MLLPCGRCYSHCRVVWLADVIASGRWKSHRVIFILVSVLRCQPEPHPKHVVDGIYPHFCLGMDQELAITSAKSIQIRHNICQQRIHYVTQHLSQYKTVTSVLQTKNEKLKNIIYKNILDNIF